MTNDRTILITGVTGNQGGAVAQALEGSGFYLRGLTRMPDGERVAALARQGVPGELIRWQVLDLCNIVTFSSPDRLDFSFLFLNVTDLKGIRAGRHFRVALGWRNNNSPATGRSTCVFHFKCVPNFGEGHSQSLQTKPYREFFSNH
jgi:nucleoside-diphosphate-sugar epimerase